MMEVGEIVRRLAARIDDLVVELLPAGRRQGEEWRVGSIAGEPGQSLGVRLRGQRAGIWSDFASADRSQRGDALDLVAMVLFGGDKTQALRWARAWLGIDQAGAGSFQTRQAARPVEREGAERDEEGRRQKALALFLAGKPLVPGDPAALYLAGRGLPLEGFARPPRALRFLAECWNSETGLRLPAMVAAVTKRGRHVATHRTWLMAERSSWTKARLRVPKKVLGSFGGGVIPLWRGASGKPIAEAVEGETTAIAEGIEDALTLALAEQNWRALACVSISNMAAVELPPACEDIVLAFDRDGENPQARQARERAVRALLEQGRSVREVKPPEGFKDFNAWHQAMCADQARSALGQQGRGVA